MWYQVSFVLSQSALSLTVSHLRSRVLKTLLKKVDMLSLEMSPSVHNWMDKALKHLLTPELQFNSVIDKEVLQEVYKEQLLKLQTDNLGDVKTVSGEALPILGMFTTALDIANGSFSCTFIVVQDLPYDALLGRDFPRENGAIINLKESI